MSGHPLRSAVAAVLELIASERPDLLDFQFEVLLTSSAQLAVRELAAALQVSLKRVDVVMHKASRDLDEMEKRRTSWWDPAQTVEAPNLAALLHACGARAARVGNEARLRKLETIRRKLEWALEKSRIEDFIGPPPAPSNPEGG